MGWMIMNCWQKLIERLDLSSCGLTDMPSLPSRHCKTIKELDISSNIQYFQKSIIFNFFNLFWHFLLFFFEKKTIWKF